MIRTIESIEASRVVAAVAAAGMTFLLACVPMTLVWVARIGA